jgi:hypothetical protein
VSATNGTTPTSSLHVGQVVLLRDDTGALRRWVVTEERRHDGTLWVGLRPA